MKRPEPESRELPAGAVDLAALVEQRREERRRKRADGRRRAFKGIVGRRP